MRDWNFVYAMYDGYQSGILRYNFYKDYKANRDKHYSNSQNDYDKAIDDYCKKVLQYSKEKKTEVKRGETEDESFERQREILYMILENLFVRQIMCDDVEGDDLIAQYVKNKKSNEKICIVSGDRDLTQLISDDVCIYVTQTKEIITKDNHLSKMGFPHENVVLKKILCGDSSDNIIGIKGLGETSFFKYFPEARERKISLDEIIEKATDINCKRIDEKKKPLQVLKNIVERKTLGIQGEEIYEINRKLIDLSIPLLTEDAENEIDAMSYAPLDPEDRGFKNVFEIIKNNKMENIFEEDKFGIFFSEFHRLMDKEMKFYKLETKENNL